MCDVIMAEHQVDAYALLCTCTYIGFLSKRSHYKFPPAKKNIKFHPHKTFLGLQLTTDYITLKCHTWLRLSKSVQSAWCSFIPFEEVKVSLLACGKRREQKHEHPSGCR